MADDVQKVGLEAVLDDNDFDKGLSAVQKGMDTLVKKSDDTAKKSSQAFTYWSNVVQGALSTAGGFFIDKISGMVVDGFRGMIDGAAEAQEIEAQLNAVLEATGESAGITKDAAVDLAGSFAKLTIFEDDAILSAETVLLRFKGISKETFPDATKATLDLATSLKMDLSGAAKLLGKALEDPATGMNRLRTAGVNLTDEQEKMVKAMIDTGDTAGAQKLILDELTKSIGGTAEAAGKTFSGQLKILQNDLGNVFEEIGTDLLPVLIELAKEGKETLVPMIKEDLLPAVKSFTTFLSAEGVPAVKKFFDELRELDSVNKEWSALFAEMRGTARDSENGMVEDAGITLPNLVDIIGWVMESWKTRQKAGLDVARDLWKSWEYLTQGDLTSWGLAIGDAMDHAMTGLLSIIGINGVSIRETLNSIFGQALSDAINWGNNFIIAGENVISGIVTGLWNSAQDVVNALSGIINQAIAAMLGNLGIKGGSSGFGTSGASTGYSVAPSRTSYASSNVSTNTSNYFNLNINSSSVPVRVGADFSILKSLAGA